MSPDPRSAFPSEKSESGVSAYELKMLLHHVAWLGGTVFSGAVRFFAKIPLVIQDQPVRTANIGGQARSVAVCGERIHLQEVGRGTELRQKMIKERVAVIRSPQISGPDKQPFA